MPARRPVLAGTLATRRRAWDWICRHRFPGVMVGRLKFMRSRKRGDAARDAFNGQASRRALFLAIVDKIAPFALVETGTFLGITTEFMSRTGLSLFTAESHARYFGIARGRLRHTRNVSQHFGDSRAMLRKLFAGPLHDPPRPVFFYLDAHWYKDLPLEEELRLIFAYCPLAVVMIDDFQVPSDAGYGYDDYGPGRALTFDYVAGVVTAARFQVFYPATPATEETGLRRGCVVLVKDSAIAARLAELPLLRAAR